VIGLLPLPVPAQVGARFGLSLGGVVLIVGRARPGSMLGDDRGDFRGPWLVRRVVRHLHRHTGRVPTRSIRRIDWEDSHLTIDGPVEPLE
jgi:hypothetical protein